MNVTCMSINESWYDEIGYDLKDDSISISFLHKKITNII